jgi:glc operon protein GlcG
MRVTTSVLLAVLASAPSVSRAQEALTIDKKVLTLGAARLVIAAAEAEATARRLGVVVVVVDDAGNVIQLSRMDAAQVASVAVGIGKARTAAIYRRPSRDFEEQIRNGRVAALALADATPLQGGVPISIDGKVVGAVGVSGDSPQADEEIALAGAAALDRRTPAASPVTAVTLIHGIAGRETELKQHLIALAAPTRAEPGAITYDLYQSPIHPHEFMRFEVWRSAEALEQHKKTPHLRDSFEKRRREGWTTEIVTWTRVPESAPK